MTVKGVFIINATKEEAQRHILQIWNRYFNKYGNNFRQNVAMLRTTCRDMISMIDNYFVTDMAAATRYREILTGYANQDNHTQESLLVVYSILVDFKTMIDQSIPIKDLPSCKKTYGIVNGRCYCRSQRPYQKRYCKIWNRYNSSRP